MAHQSYNANAHPTLPNRVAPSKTDLCNMALAKLGSSRLQLSNFDTDTGNTKDQLALQFDTTLEQLVRMHRWNCCKKRSILYPYSYTFETNDTYQNAMTVAGTQFVSLILNDNANSTFANPPTFWKNKTTGNFTDYYGYKQPTYSQFSNLNSSNFASTSVPQTYVDIADTDGADDITEQNIFMHLHPTIKQDGNAYWELAIEETATTNLGGGSTYNIVALEMGDNFFPPVGNFTTAGANFNTSAPEAVPSKDGITEAVTKQINSSGTTATVTYTSHKFLVGDVVIVSSATADGSIYNGTFNVVSVATDGNSFTYTLPSTPSSSPVNASIQQHAMKHTYTLTRDRGSFGFEYMYGLPSDCVRVESLSKNKNNTHIKYINEFSIEGQAIHTDCEKGYLLYFGLPETYQMDSLFREAFVTLLAHNISYTITGDLTISKFLLGQFNNVIMPEARRVNGFEGNRLPVVDSEFLEATFTSGSSINNSYPPFSQTSYGTL